jgi:AcrR family transcriptional regulator
MSDTKAKLLRAAAETLRAEGIAGVSARTIAGRAGVNQALVFYHFSTVNELIAAATKQSVDERVEVYRAAFAKIQSLTELLALGRTLHDQEREAGNVAIMAQLMAGAQQNPDLAAAARYAMTVWTDEIETVVRRVLAPSPLALIADPKGLARTVSAAFIGLELYEGVDPDGAEDALAALDDLAVLVDVVDDLGPVARRALQRRVRRRSTPSKGARKSDTTM